MPAMMTKKVLVSAAQYAALAGAPPVLPSQRELFDYQLAFWVNAGLANADEALRLAEFIPERGLFILVPRRPEPLNYGAMMKRVVLENRPGVTYLDQQYLTDEVETPQGPYLALDVEDGRSRLNTRPMDSRKNIAKAKRSPYVAFEGIVHAAVFPSVLQHHFMDCCGSRYRRQRVPGVCVSDDKPALYYFGFEDNAHPEWGAPSCGSRKGL